VLKRDDIKRGSRAGKRARGVSVWALQLLMAFAGTSLSTVTAQAQEPAPAAPGNEPAPASPPETAPASPQTPPPASPEQAAPPATPDTCTKSEFESAVDEAAEKLRELNNTHRPTFQAKLRQLKDKRAWNNDQFLKEAAPFVKDDQITVFDDKSNELLASISSMGQEGANASEPNCKMLADLRSLMGVLVETQGAKWTYMFQKLDTELAK
jgi:hypothetical protein